MDLRFIYRPSEFLQLQAAERAAIAKAATAAVQDATDLALKLGRQSIAGAGFPSSSQNALSEKLFPGHRDSLNPLGLIYTKKGYEAVFETGATIEGHPFLWIPLPNVPLGSSGRQLTPKQFIDRIGPLHSVNRPGKPPLLVGRGSVSSGVVSATKTKVRFKKRALKSGILGEQVPLFVGVHSITEPKKFDIAGAAEEARSRLPEFYIEHLNG